MCIVAQQLQQLVLQLTSRVTALEKGSPVSSVAPAPVAAAVVSQPAKKEEDADDDDDDFDLFEAEVLHMWINYLSRNSRGVSSIDK